MTTNSSPLLSPIFTALAYFISLTPLLSRPLSYFSSPSYFSYPISSIIMLIKFVGLVVTTFNTTTLPFQRFRPHLLPLFSFRCILYIRNAIFIFFSFISITVLIRIFYWNRFCQINLILVFSVQFLVNFRSIS